MGGSQEPRSPCRDGATSNAVRSLKKDLFFSFCFAKMNLYQTYEVSSLHQVDFPACNNPTTLEDAFDAAARKQADTWLTWNNDFFEDYEGSQANFNHVVQPSPWGLD